MEIINKYDPTILGKYAIANGLTDKYIWLWDKSYENNMKKVNIIVWNILTSKIS